MSWEPGAASPEGRRLHGRRGLKSALLRIADYDTVSPPSRAAWIEIVKLYGNEILAESPPSRAAWIEIFCKSCQSSYMSSPPSRAAWIEISKQ